MQSVIICVDGDKELIASEREVSLGHFSCTVHLRPLLVQTPCGDNSRLLNLSSLRLLYRLVPRCYHYTIRIRDDIINKLDMAGCCVVFESPNKPLRKTLMW